MGALTILNAINTPVTAVLILIFFVEFCSLRNLAVVLFYGGDTDIGKKHLPGHSIFRPGLDIVKLRCPSTYIMPIWTVVVLFTLVAWQTVPDTSYPILGENLAKCDKRNKLAYQAELVNACEIARNHRDVAGALMVMTFAFFFLHSIITYFRVRKRITVAKWPTLIICEIAKTITAAFFLAGALSFKDTGETTAGSAFFVSMCIVFMCLITITLGRIVALNKIKKSPGGLTSANFNAQYFGTDPKCPFATWVFPWEKKMESASKTSRFEGQNDMALKNVKNPVGTDVEAI